MFKIIEFFGKYLFLKNPHICGKNAKKPFDKDQCFIACLIIAFCFGQLFFVRSFVDLNFTKIVLEDQWPSWPITYASSLFGSGVLHT